ncbi:MAG: hypothetical protein ACREPX_11140, partial [Rhodanobacteraceae bacterium]
MSLRRILLALCIVCASAHAASAPERRALAITDVTIVDVEKGRATHPQTVLIEAGRIVAIVAPDTAHIPPDAEQLDGRG